MSKIIFYLTIGSIYALALSVGNKTILKYNPLTVRKSSLQPSTRLFSKPNDEKRRKIIKYDNVGDPIYEDEINLSEGGINVLGLNVAVDPLTLSLLIFGAIAFNFFVLANL